jgi:hypothetical protein
MEFDEEAGVLRIGTGSWGPVSRNMYDYEVGGRAVINSWFNYRRANPTGRVTSPLDEILPTTWQSEWTNELTDLLSAIRRLTRLDEAQATLLRDVLAGPHLSLEAHTNRGYAGPLDVDRTPRYDTDLLETLDFGVSAI